MQVWVPHCSTSDPVPSYYAWKSSRKCPKSLGLITHISVPDRAPQAAAFSLVQALPLKPLEERTSRWKISSHCLSLSFSVTLTFPLIKYFFKPTAKHLLPWLHSVPRNSHAQYLIPRATVSRDSTKQRWLGHEGLVLRNWCYREGNAFVGTSVHSL